MGANNKRLTYDFVKSEFEKAGCKLLSKEYINARAPLLYICNCGNEATIRYDNFRQGKRCNDCRYKKIAKKRRLDYSHVREYFREQGCVLLSDTYVNSQTKLKYVCECGNTSEIRFNNFKQGQRCAKCRIVKISGENSPHYKPYLTDEHRLKGRNDVDLRDWRKDVFARDDYTCYKCGKRGTELNAHHINGYDSFSDIRYMIENGVTLCKNCHIEFHRSYGFGDNTFTQFLKWQSNRVINK